MINGLRLILCSGALIEFYLHKMIPPGVSGGNMSIKVPLFVTAGLVLYSKLAIVQISVESVFSEEFLVVALFDDVTVLHYKDNVSLADS